MLRAAKASGLSNLPKIADLDEDPDFALHYLSESIRYELGEEEKGGLLLFMEILQKTCLLSSNSNKIKYF